MADNVVIYGPDGETILGYVHTKERAEDIHNEVVELNVGGTTEDLWDGALRAGTELVGKFGIDQTTPGTTNLVSIGTDGEVTLAAGAEAIGKLAANSGVDIGDVDVLSLPAITAIPHAVDFTASQTGEAIWTPASGKKFLIVGYHLSFSAAGTITVWETATDNLAGRVFKHFGAANGGATAAFAFVSRAADNVLKYTTGAGAAGSLTVFGYEV